VGEMKVLVAYASKAGSTKGIAEFIGEKLRGHGMLVDVLAVESVENLGSYDAFVIGSALYQYHWLKEATEFVFRNKTVLASRAVWLFSSGPTGTKRTDQKGRDLKEVSGPKEIYEIQKFVNPRDHRVFFGAFFPEKLKGAVGWFAKWAPKDTVGDFRDWNEIEGWSDQIANALQQKPQEAITI
jgi:menaquinone-dependent protoporphyrinogen oxidase